MKVAKRIPLPNERMVRARSGGVCEGCGKKPATQMHHRRYKSRGGGHEVSNLLHLCGSGNHTGCHGDAHTAEGETWGWSVESGFRAPAGYPVLYRGRRARLTDDGEVEELAT